MPIREILRAVVFLNRNADGKDFSEVVNCIPDERMADLEIGLAERKDVGEINTVQIGRYRMQAANFTDYADEVDKFFAKIDLQPYSSTNRMLSSEDKGSGLTPDKATRFTGFDEVN